MGVFRPPSLADLAELDVTYPEVGATATRLPNGYRHVRRSVVLGHGRPAFENAASALQSWSMHSRAGFRVIAAGPATQPGEDVLLVLGHLRFGVVAPCRIVYVTTEPARRGFAYGTLPGHPEIGEEAFQISYGDDESVTFDVSAFSRPGSRLARIGAPLAAMVQDRLTERYLKAMRELTDVRSPD
jgi:uncharacterized protein (UPF0548 family)